MEAAPLWGAGVTTHEVILPLFSPMANAPTKRYRTLVADPPWRYLDKQSAPYEKGPKYGVMELHKIMNLPIGTWALDDAHLYLWTTNTFLEDSFKVVKSWGFDYRTTITWVKGRIDGNRLIHHIGTGYHYRNSTEHILFCTRGNLATRYNDVPTAFVAERHGHSVKPAAFYDLVARMSPGPYLDVFARNQRFVGETEFEVMDTFGDQAFNFGTDKPASHFMEPAS